MNYRREMKKMQKHRRGYFPAMAMLMELYSKADDMDLPVDITDAGELPVILELLDLGYIDPDALTVKEYFGTVTACLFRGIYPLTPNGDFAYEHRGGAFMSLAEALSRFFGR